MTISFPFYIHGPKSINGVETYAITEGIGGKIWAFSPTREQAELIGALLNGEFYKSNNQKCPSCGSNLFFEPLSYCQSKSLHSWKRTY